MKSTTNELLELTLEDLIKKYGIQNEEEYDLLKNGKAYIDSALRITDDKVKMRLGSALIEYLLYKLNGGK